MYYTNNIYTNSGDHKAARRKIQNPKKKAKFYNNDGTVRTTKFTLRKS